MRLRFFRHGLYTEVRAKEIAEGRVHYFGIWIAPQMSRQHL